MLKPVADDQSALTVFLEARLERHDDFTIAVLRVGANDVGIHSLRVEDILVRRLLDRLTGVFVQLRFDIKTLQVADAATEENPNDGFRFGWEVRLAIGSPPRRRVGI